MPLTPVFRIGESGDLASKKQTSGRVDNQPPDRTKPKPQEPHPKQSQTPRQSPLSLDPEPCKTLSVSHPPKAKMGPKILNVGPGSNNARSRSDATGSWLKASGLGPKLMRRCSVARRAGGVLVPSGGMVMAASPPLASPSTLPDCIVEVFCIAARQRCTHCRLMPFAEHRGRDFP